MLNFLKKHFYVIGIIYALIALISFPKWTIDDAYIICRYADNLAHHGQLTWNVGEDPIEGYTGLAFPLALAFFIKLGISPVFVGKIIGVLSYFSGGLLLALALKKLETSDFARALVLLLYFTAPFSFSHAWGGLETMLYSAALLACIFLFLSLVTASKPRPSIENGLLVALLLTGLVRPEAVLLAAIFFLALAHIKRSEAQGQLRSFVLRFVGIFLIPGLIYFLWRWQYYGQLLPNPYYVKSSPGLINKGSLLSLAYFTLYYLMIPFLVCAVLYLSNPQALRQHLSRRYIGYPKGILRIILISLLGFMALVYIQYLRSRLLINFEFRFFAQYFPIFLLAMGVFLSAGFASWQEQKHPAIIILVVALVLLQLAVNVFQLNKYKFNRGSYKSLIEQEHIPAGFFVRENVPPAEWLIVVHDAGAIPYYAGHRTIDFGRLNNEYLLGKNLSKSDILDYFYAIGAGAVVITSYNWEEVRQSWIFGREAEQIVQDPRFDRYKLAQKYKIEAGPGSPSTDYYEFLYLRQDLYAAWCLNPNPNPHDN